MKNFIVGLILIFFSLYLFSLTSSKSDLTENSTAIARARIMLLDFSCSSYSAKWGRLAQENRQRAEKYVQLFDEGINPSTQPIDVVVSGELEQFRHACEQSIKEANTPQLSKADPLAKAEELMKQFHCSASFGRYKNRLNFFKSEALSIIDDVKSGRNLWISLGPVDARVGSTLSNFQDECKEAKKAAKATKIED